MSVFLDTNVLVAAVTADTERSDAAVDLLNSADASSVSVLNLMALRSVLAKKKSSIGSESTRLNIASRPGQRLRSQTHRT